MERSSGRTTQFKDPYMLRKTFSGTKLKKTTFLGKGGTEKEGRDHQGPCISPEPDTRETL